MPSDGGVEDDRCAVDDREFVVPGRQAQALLQPAEAALDHFALFVVDGVVGDGPVGVGATALVVSLLIAWFRHNGLDSAAPQVRADCPGRVRLVAVQSVRTGPRPNDQPCRAQLTEQRTQHRGITCLAMRDPTLYCDLSKLRHVPTCGTVYFRGSVQTI